MSPVAFEVAQLFDGFPEPVLILREREVRYRNPAAERLFPALRDRATLPEDLSALLPECEAPAVVTARIGGGNYRLSVQNTSLGALVILRSAPAAAAGYGFAYESELASLLTLGDPSLLRRMLLALLSNAMKAAGPGGKLGLRLARSGQRAVLTVWDGGNGLAEGDLSLLFGGEPDGGRAGTGLGTGLESVRRIAALHGGSVMVASREGDGLRVVVSLPIRDTAGMFLRAPAASYDPSGGFSPLLLELSDVLPAELYRPEDVE